MSLLNPTLGARAQRRQAASLVQTVEWTLRRLWTSLERMGQRRAAPQLRAIARRLGTERQELAQRLNDTARQWMSR